MDFKLFYEGSLAMTVLQVLESFIASPPTPLKMFMTIVHFILVAT